MVQITSRGPSHSGWVGLSMDHWTELVCFVRSLDARGLGILNAPEAGEGEPGRGLSALQLDLATVILRLRQIRREGGSEFLWDRVITGDLPRLESHLCPDTVELMLESPEG